MSFYMRASRICGVCTCAGVWEDWEHDGYRVDSYPRGPFSCHSRVLDPADIGSAPWLEIVCFLPGISQNGGPPDISGLLG